MSNRRTYGRVVNADGTYKWTQVSTDANGNSDAVYLTTLIQCLKLNLGESPFFANYGIPAHPSVLTQVFPDFYVNQTQQQFAPYFASLTITKTNSTTPTYNIQAITHNGATISASIPV
ncbi:MAG: hypothetical protein JSV72_07225 [Ralstonia sp.]|jgi:hypothetical protein|nr:MAG: hypothetical protein JSV72_07225 [Ralstonia sp.]